MPHITGDRVKETTTTTGTGALTPGGAVSGFDAFSTRAASGDVFFYCIVHQTSAEWEVGLGSLTGTPTITRDVVLQSSNGDALVNFSAGTKHVFICDPSLAYGLLAVVRNETGGTIPIFSTVYESGTGSGLPLVNLADADLDSAMPALGITIAAINNNANGLVRIAGRIVNVNTSGFSVGDILYVSQTAGGFTTTPPAHPALRQRVARVLTSATSGTAFVFIRQESGNQLGTNQDEYAIGNVANGGVIRLLGVAAIPSAPSADQLRVYARNRSGRMFLEMIGPSGVETSLQPALFGNNITMWLPGTGTTAAINFGVNWTTAATQAHPGIANTNFMTQMKRATYTTTTTAGNASGVRTGAAVAWRGNAAGLGGFFFFARFGILTYTTTMTIWVGLSGVTGLLAGDPTAQNDTIAMVKNTGSTTWVVMSRDTTATSDTSTGRTTAAAGTAEIFDFMAFCAPNASNIVVRVVDITGPTVLVNNVSKTTNLPTNSVMLTAHAECRNVTGGAGSAVAMFLNRIYIESDS